MPDRLWLHPLVTRAGRPAAQSTVATHMALQAAWRRQVMTTLHLLWQWRTAAEKPNAIWVSQRAVALHLAHLRGVLDLRTPQSAATKHTAASLEAAHARLDTALPAPAPSDPSALDTRYLLFFDGGSRGNPGPGGAGAVIVRVAAQCTTPTIVWSAAMAYQQRSTTNNQAEYAGLLTGLTAASAHAWTPLEVIGDSQMIIRQLSEYRAPHNSTLLTKYACARRLADTLHVDRRHHHPRAANRMANAAANLAMNSAASSQVHHPTRPAGHASLLALLPEDFALWRDRKFAIGVV